MFNKAIIILEVKPFPPRAPADYVPQRTWEELLEIAAQHGDWISIQTHRWFRGSFDLISRARSLTDKPILAKGWHTDDEVEQLIEIGATNVLVINRIPHTRYNSQCLIEPYYREEFLRIPPEFKMVWNSRDLFALENQLPQGVKEDFSIIRDLRPDVWLCQASNIKKVTDIHPEANAALIGTNLEEFVASL